MFIVVQYEQALLTRQDCTHLLLRRQIAAQGYIERTEHRLRQPLCRRNTGQRDKDGTLLKIPAVVCRSRQRQPRLAYATWPRDRDQLALRVTNPLTQVSQVTLAPDQRSGGNGEWGGD